MNKANTILLRCLGVNRPKPKTRFGLYLRRAEHTVSILAVLYALLLIFPQTILRHSVTADARGDESASVAAEARKALQSGAPK